MSRNGFAFAALLVAWSVSVPLARADVIELRTGERVEGAFKGADAAAVRIEVDGRVLTFRPAEVRAIYYGPAPAVAPAVGAPVVPVAERDAALWALAALRSVARTGVTYQEYAPRLGEARAAVDRYLRAEDGAPAIKGAIAGSLQFYALAGTAWNASRTRGNYAVIGSDGALNECEPAQQVIAESKRKAPYTWRSKGAGDAATTGMVIANEGLGALWACGADKLAAAERLREGKKR